jgi:predicted ribosome quality control (RQC) complex YloA/Tae2 family protein
MDHRRLRAWVEAHSSPRDLVFDDIQRSGEDLLIRWKRQRRNLLIHLGSDDCLAFFTEREDIPFGRGPEAFRNTLVKAVAVGVTIDPRDRVMFIHFRKATPYNRSEEYILVLEMIPRYGNLILLRDGRIIDALRTFTPAQNPSRPIVPEQPYLPPEPPKSPPMDDTEPLPDDLDAFFEARFFEKVMGRRTTNLRKTILSRLQKELAKKSGKLAKQDVELRDANDECRWRQYSELLRGVFKQLEPSMTEITVTDWFDPAQSQIAIPLLAGMSPTRNIAEYARKARKAKSGREMIVKQMARTRDEIAMLENRIAEIERTETYSELAELNADDRAERNEHHTRAPFRRIPINDDWEIQIGRTATENDLLTTRVSRPEDWWFHCRVFRGTHVVLRNHRKLEPPEPFIRVCASLAAYYSQAKHSNKVPVDYTQIRYVRKPRGSVPGYVIYTHQKTLFADPMDIRAAAKTLGVAAKEE